MYLKLVVVLISVNVIWANNRTCPDGQHYETCGTACPETCQYPISEICSELCVGDCFCDNETLLDETINKCVRPENCTCTNNKKYYNCGPCPYKCEHYGNTCTGECFSGCFCPNGTVELDGNCVPKEECIVCPLDEIYKCGSTCPPTCNSPEQKCLSDSCEMGCFCLKGFLREEMSGRCVAPKDCPGCPEDEELSLCGGDCEKTCTNPEGTCDIDNCKSDCVCTNGQVRDTETNYCVPIDDCPEIIEECPEDTMRDIYTGKCVKHNCPINQHFKYCGTACPPTCDQPNLEKCKYECVDNCFCDYGTILDTIIDKCVLPEDCICPIGKEYHDCGPCPDSCENRYKPCKCIKGCFCPNGTLEQDGKCVSREKCRCPSDKIYKCGSPCSPTCTFPVQTCSSTPCEMGCFCWQEDLLDETSGLCVAPEDCPVCPEGETFSLRGGNCEETCVNLEGTYDTDNCKPGCVCPNGQVRNTQTNQCVSINDCPEPIPDCAVNEHYEYCGTSCPPTCEFPNPVMCEGECFNGCFCDFGTILDAITDECVHPENCTCPSGKNYYNCGPCPHSCESQFQPCEGKCIKGCFCPNGTVEDSETGICVPKEQCICTGDKVYECGSICPPTCIFPNRTCAWKICKRGCFCRDGNILDETTGQCVAPENCPKCPKGEELSLCGGDCEATLANPKGTCNKDNCKPGCVCANEKVRNTITKQCVLINNGSKKSSFLNVFLLVYICIFSSKLLNFYVL